MAPRHAPSFEARSIPTAVAGICLRVEVRDTRGSDNEITAACPLQQLSVSSSVSRKRLRKRSLHWKLASTASSYNKLPRSAVDRQCCAMSAIPDNETSKSSSPTELPTALRECARDELQSRSARWLSKCVGRCAHLQNRAELQPACSPEVEPRLHLPHLEGDGSKSCQHVRGAAAQAWNER